MGTRGVHTCKSTMARGTTTGYSMWNLTVIIPVQCYIYHQACDAYHSIDTNIIVISFFHYKRKCHFSPFAKKAFVQLFIALSAQAVPDTKLTLKSRSSVQALATLQQELWQWTLGIRQEKSGRFQRYIKTCSSVNTQRMSVDTFPTQLCPKHYPFHLQRRPEVWLSFSSTAVG